MFFKTLFVFLLLNFLSSFSYGQNCKPFFRQDYTYIESEKSFYKLHTRQDTFASAKQTCATEGASLFYAEDENEVNVAISFWLTNHHDIVSVFVGLSDILTEGVFETVDGRPITEVYNKWEIFEPDNYRGIEDCVHMDVMGLLSDYRCDIPAHFICKKRQQNTNTTDYHCHLPNLENTSNNNTSKCYKVHTTPLDWTDAQAVCQAEHASLALISNRMEGDALANLASSTPKLRLNTQYERGVYHLGFHNRFGAGWQTVSGAPMNVDADLWYENYQPDGNLSEECGAMFFNGRLVNTICYMKALFICERDVGIATPCHEESNN